MKRALERIDTAWSRAELVLACVVSASLVASLLAWVVLKGLAAQTTSAFVAGAVLRAAVLGLGGAALTWRFSKRSLATAAALLVGVGLGVVLRDVGVAWAGNVLGWAQDGSTLTLVGGLRGLATRLTLLLVLVGASIATAQGRHLTIDVVARMLPSTGRTVAAMTTGLVSATVCLVSAWGFFDFLAIDGFHARMDDAPSTKWSAVGSGLGRDVFLFSRQVALDVKVGPRVLGGTRWDTTLTGAEWNAWLDAADWSGVADVTALREQPEATHVPLVVTGTDAPRGLLVKPLSLVVPLGLLLLALRFLLWVLRGAPVESAHGAAS
ncbi:MAG: hypothetical protein JNM69_33060 [Archangium sp.]|nr:hypothetical protein [Archangium sp.]